MRFLAISGSLRPESSNTALLRALAALAPEDLEITLFQGLGDLPHFDPGLKLDPLHFDAPPSVMNLRAALASAEAVIFCTPEYAFGMPGVLKNALDWAVSMAVLEHKPAAALAASPSNTGGEKAHQGLLWVLAALGMELPEGASFTVPHIRSKLNAAGDITDPALRERLAVCLRALARAVEARRGAQP